MKKLLGNIKGEDGRGIINISSESNTLKIKYSDNTEQSINLNIKPNIDVSNLSTNFKMEKIFEGSSNSISVNTKDYVFFILDNNNEVISIPSIIGINVHDYYTDIKVEEDKLTLNNIKKRKLYGFKCIAESDTSQGGEGSGHEPGYESHDNGAPGIEHGPPPPSPMASNLQDGADTLFSGKSEKLTLTKKFTSYSSLDVTFLDTIDSSTFVKNFKITKTTSDYYIYEPIKDGLSGRLYVHDEVKMQIYGASENRFFITKVIGLDRR